MDKYIRHHKYELSILGMPWKKVSVIKDKDTGQRGEAMYYEGESFENLDRKAWERMKQDKKSDRSCIKMWYPLPPKTIRPHFLASFSELHMEASQRENYGVSIDYKISPK